MMSNAICKFAMFATTFLLFRELYLACTNVAEYWRERENLIGDVDSIGMASSLSLGGIPHPVADLRICSKLKYGYQ